VEAATPRQAARGPESRTLEEDACGGVVRFGAAARNDNLLRRGVQERRHVGTRILDDVAGGSAGPMVTRGVAVMLPEQRLQGCHNFGSKRRTGVEIEIDAPFAHWTAGRRVT
jgi:hypothetical protein